MSDYLFDTPRPVGLVVRIGKGSVRIDAVETTSTRVEVEGDGADQVVVDQDGDQISVIAPRQRTGFFGGEPDLDVTVTLPVDSDVKVRTGSAEVDVEGPVGSCHIKSGSGDVRVDTPGGPAVIETGSGDITVGTAGAELRVKSGSGDVAVGHTESSTVVSTGSGDVTITTATGPTAIKTGSGDLLVDDSHGDLSLTTGSGDMVVGTAHRGRFSANGASGDVRIGIPPGVPVWTDVSTVTGDIRSDLVGAGEPADGADHIEVRAKTATGDIVLRQL